MQILHSVPIKPDFTRHNLVLLWWLRSIAIVGQSVAILIVIYGLQISLAVAPLARIIGFLACVNGLTYLRIRMKKQVSEREFFAQLIVDMLCLAGLLYWTGGASNPFTSLFILQVVIAAIMLRPRFAWVATCIAIGLYTFLMVFKTDIPSITHQHGGDFFNLHVQGMWVSFMLLALLVAWFVARMAETFRRQDALLVEAQQMAARGAFAANAAHDLGTPLATMAILAGSYREAAHTIQAAEQAEILTAQIVRCKTIISQIATSAGVIRAESGEGIALDRFLEQTANAWQETYPGHALIQDLGGTHPAPVIVAEQGLAQALCNLLSNAADASPHAVTFLARWTQNMLDITVRDKGEGIRPDLLAQLGMPGVTSKPDGLGMGLYLAKNMIGRLGGELRYDTAFSDAEKPGAQFHIHLPLKKLAL